MSTTAYILFDGRAAQGDLDTATVMSIVATLPEVAKTNRLFRDIGRCWYEAEAEVEADGQHAYTINGRRQDLDRHGLPGAQGQPGDQQPAPVTPMGVKPEPADQQHAVDASGWFPIETAPKNGTRIDLWVIHPDRPAYRVTDCRWFVDGEYAEWMTPTGGTVEGFGFPGQPYLIRATHWRRAPGPPGEG